MIDPESPQPNGLDSVAARLLALAENNPEDRIRLIKRWADAESWTPVEGIALAWTLDPATLGRPGSPGKGPEDALPEEASRCLALARRGPLLSLDRITPARFIEWAHSVDLAFHPDWRRAVDLAEEAAARTRAKKQKRKREFLIDRWARASYWSPEEGTVLAFDLDPRTAISRWTPGDDQPNFRAPADANHLWDLARRAVEVGELEETAAPIRFMSWARSVGIDFHPDWWKAVTVDEVPGEAAPPLEPAAPVPELKTREQETLLKMVAAMAMKFYGWDRNALRNTATGEIESDLAEIGVPLDPDTIRKWLRKAADLIPEQEP